MIINREKMLVGLELAKLGLVKKDSAEYTFIADRVYTCNEEIFTSIPIGTTFGDDGVQVNAKDFINTITNISEEEFNMEVKEKDGGKYLSVVSPSVKAELTIYAENGIFSMIKDVAKDIVAFNNMKDLPSSLIEGLSMCAFSTSKLTSHGVLTSVLVRDGSVYSSELYRASKYKFEGTFDGGDMLIPGFFAKELFRYDVTRYSNTNAWNFFANENGIVVGSRRIEGKFPNTQDLFNEMSGEEITFPDNFKNEVKAIMHMVDAKNEAHLKIKVQIDPDFVCLKAEKFEGKMEKTIPFETDNPAIVFSINPNYLLQILEKTTKVVIGTQQAMFSDGICFSHIICIERE